MKDTQPPSVGQILTGPLFNEPMRVETVQANGPASWIAGLVGSNSERFRKVTMTAGDLARLTVLEPQHSFNGDGRLLRLGLQAYALGIASSASRAAQRGPLEVVTTDRAGNLAGDGGALFRDVGKALEGAALAIALDAPHVPLGQRFAVSGRWGGLEGKNALGLNAAVRLSDIFQLDGGVAVGMGDSTFGGTVGGTFTW